MIVSAVRARRATSTRDVPVLGVVVGALRVKQWTKNLLLFAGLLFAAKIGDGGRWMDAWLAFVAYCAASSAAYLLNDVRDADLDRLHPRKRLRPVASGQLSARRAVAMAAVLGTVALSGAAVLGAAAVVFVAGFMALQLVYSFGLKVVVGLDVLAIAALFSIRAAAGAEAVRVRVSPVAARVHGAPGALPRARQTPGRARPTRCRSSARARSLLACRARPSAGAGRLGNDRLLQRLRSDSAALARDGDHDPVRGGRDRPLLRPHPSPRPRRAAGGDSGSAICRSWSPSARGWSRLGSC